MESNDRLVVLLCELVAGCRSWELRLLFAGLRLEK